MNDTVCMEADDKREIKKHMEEHRAGMNKREHEHDGVDVPERMGLDLQALRCCQLRPFPIP